MRDLSRSKRLWQFFLSFSKILYLGCYESQNLIAYHVFLSRFQEDNAEVLKLREKEKGDWKKLTLAEKKVLYRASFCQTIAEVRDLIVKYVFKNLMLIYYLKGKMKL